MAKSVVGVGDARAVKRYGAALVHETSQSSFTMRNLTSTSGDLPIHRLTDLESQAGDQITVDIYHRLTSTGQYGDVNLVGTQEKLTSDTMTMLINQVSNGVNAGSIMSRKRTLWNHREIAMMKQREWWGRWYDEQFFVTAAGTRGAQTGDWLLPVGYTGYAGNTIAAYSSDRAIIHHSQTAENALTSNDFMDMEMLEYIQYQLKTMSHPPKPCMIDGEELYLLILNPYSEWTLRKAAGAGDWAQIKKYAKEGQNEIFRDSLGRFGNLLMFSHSKIPKTNSGASSVAVDHNLLLGRQAVAVAHGNASQAGQAQGQQFRWHEELANLGTELLIQTFAIVGHKKVVLKLTENASAASDFGVLSVLTYGGAAVS